MHWDNIDSGILRMVAGSPGGTSIADALFRKLDIKPGMKILDISPGPGILASIVAKQYGVRMTTLVGGADDESATESAKAKIGVGDNVRVIPGTVTTIPEPSEEFDVIFSMGYPFNPPPESMFAKEIYRVLAPDGVVGIAGPCGIANFAPEYFESALEEAGVSDVKTPAYAALMFAREGFHILTAEFFPDARDHWNAWLKSAPSGIVTDSLRRALVEDNGRWMSLGLVVLKKPPKPAWAL